MIGKRLGGEEEIFKDLFLAFRVVKKIACHYTITEGEREREWGHLLIKLYDDWIDDKVFEDKFG